jgi:N-acetylmuramoyl-L-alanine amidase
MKFLLLLLILSVTTFAQDLTGKKLGLDPGHGFIPGQASVCNDAETKRFESWMNHYVVPQLKKYLQNAGAQIITTRADYDSIGPCITLTQRKTIANNNNVHFFHSVHHNAFQGNTNYSLVLFKQINNQICPNGNPQWPGQADVMSNLMVPRLHQALYTTAAHSRGDFCFLGYNLGVLSTLNMPGTLSEASFFDFPAEIPRLRNLAYLKTEAEALFHSFLQYYNQPMPSHGSLVGIVQNTTLNGPAKGVTVKVIETGDTYTVDNIGNGFYRIDSLAPGNYTLKVIGPMDSSFAAVNVLGGKINKKDLTISETQVVSNVSLNGVLSAGNAINILWSRPSGTPDSIMIYLSEDGENWSDQPFRTVGGSLTGNIITDLQLNQTYYVKLKAKNSISESPDFSKTYGAYTSSATQKVLIVDGFNSMPSHNLSRYYGDLLKDLSLKHETVGNQAVTSANILRNYAYVIWFTGNESVADQTFSSSEQTLLKAYLDMGGRLFVSGARIAYDLDKMGTPQEKEFIKEYFGATYRSDSSLYNVTGANSTIFNGLNFTFGDNYTVPFADVLNTTATPLMHYNNSESIAAVYHLRSLSPDSSKVIYFAFPFESISSASDRSAVFNKVHSFFLNIQNSDNPNQALIPESLSLSVFPNPFNPSTKVMVNISVDGKYRISVHNLLGEKIVSLIDEYLAPGIYSYNLDMKNYSSGFYLVNIYDGYSVKTQKILLIK